MGEVYRADDLKLGQSVALKFLPESVDKDPARLTQLHSEVRIARQISHPHVCRVYDIDEYEGHTFLSMEYVDGEDLASLLRRVGRLAPTRAIELARQICAGLAAAHDKGVVHRDLKPANIMLDGAGQIRITDFGLAGGIGETPRAGTPAYMAPEQLAGQPVTPRSDVYALGLVLYELFTGERALTARNLAELIAKREEVDITPPTAIVRDLDPAIEHVILRCLERDPARRPATALAVAAALPGGDPLAAALAAGTTLSPDAVAAAGEDSAWALRPALASLAFVIVGLFVQAWLADRVLITGYVPMDAPAAVMADRAERIRQQLGYREPFVDSASAFSIETEYLQFNSGAKTSDELVRRLHGRPVPLHFWYRTSPGPLVPTGTVPTADPTDPPLLISGMTMTIVDTKGRLVSFQAVPPQLEASPSATGAPPAAPAAASAASAAASAASAATTTTSTARGAATQEPDWDVLFAAAELPRERFTPAAPRWTPSAYADTRAAWEGTLADMPDVPLRLEAAGYRGRISSFAIIGPWTQATQMPDSGGATASQRWSSIGGTLVVAVIIIGAVVLSRFNTRNGRGDRRAALRLAGFLFVLDFGRRMLLGAHLAMFRLDLGWAFNNMAVSILLAVATLGLYLALEPFVRRYWPNSLISWTRLLSGRVRDPRVGRDVLLGCAAGILMALITSAHNLLPLLYGQPAYPPGAPILSYLNGPLAALATMDRMIAVSISRAMTNIFALVLLRVLVRRVWLAMVLVVLLFSFNAIAALFVSNPPWFDILSEVAVLGLMAYVVVRLGVLSTLVALFFLFVLQAAPLTADVTKWFFGTSTAIVLLLGALAVYAFSWARTGEPLFGRPLVE
jgi:serine/threonine-protein kinase